MTFLLRWLYTLLLLVLLPFFFLRLRWKGRKLPAYRRRWSERLGWTALPVCSEGLWLHAVSVGEAISAVPLIRRFQKHHPNTPILVTTMTPTGSERVRAAFKEELNHTIFNVYIPYDIPFFIQRVINRIRPKLFIAMETEIWPNLFHTLKKNHVPILIANGRISPHSEKWYKRLGPVMHDLLKPVSMIAAQSLLDAERFIHIGVDAKKVLHTGNIKFDFDLPVSIIEQGRHLKKALGEQVWIAASTHAGEETLILEAFAKLKTQFPKLVLLLVPRHPDRFNEVANLCEQSGFTTHRRSHGAMDKPVDIYLGDTMGEMMLFFAASDVAFVGGSLVPVGGHNLLEPAAFQLPILTGPHLFNFLKIADLLKEVEGLSITETADQLFENVSQLLQSDTRRSLMGLRAKGVIDQNRGALDKLLRLVQQLWASADHPKWSAPVIKHETVDY